MSKVFTKEEYLNWLKTRGEIDNWKHEDCYAADAHIKQVALDNLEQKLSEQPEALRDFVMIYADVGYGSVETDEFLMKLECYPDYVEE